MVLPVDRVAAAKASAAVAESSPTRTVCERAKTAVTLPCYADEENVLFRLIDTEMRENGLASWPDPNADGSFSLPPEYQQKTPRLVDAWRNHCARYNPSGHIEVHG